MARKERQKEGLNFSSSTFPEVQKEEIVPCVLWCSYLKVLKCHFGIDIDFLFVCFVSHTTHDIGFDQVLMCSGFVNFSSS